VLHQVGVGALGPVFRTYEPTRDRLVAIKVFRLDITPEQAQALADELARTADAGLFHPSIVEPIAAGVEGSVAYRAEEYVAAETLDVAMRHYAPAPVEKVLPFIAQLAGAIDFARTAGVGHGGLHPRDVFVTPEEARAGGFGVVEALERVGIRAPVRRPYTAPERVAGEAWGATADVFSLGVIAYELLTGRRPSGMGDRIGTITGGANQAAIHAVLARAVAEGPADRFQSALAFASALDAASRGEGASIAAPASAGLAAAAAAAGALPPDPDDAMDEVPPPVVVDAQKEPVEADWEEDAFRASEPEFDEIEEREETLAAQRDDQEDDALAAFSRHDPSVSEEPFEDEPEAPLFAGTAVASTEDRDEYAAADDRLTLGRDDRDTERFADEFGETAERELDERQTNRRFDDEETEEPVAPAYAPTPAVFRDRDDTEPYAEPAVIPERAGVGIVPVALLLLLALLVGFAGGWAVRGRTPAPESDVAAGASESQSPDASSGAAPPYTEGAVTPPSKQTPAAAAQPDPASPAAAPPPAAPEPTAPVATTGEVQVRSTPSGAGVTVDGRWAGRTPLTLDELAFGAHEIRIVQPGFEVAREEVRLSADQPSRELAFKLQRTAPPPAPRAKPRPAPAKPSPPARPATYTGSIYVDSRPRGARVLVNGKLMGTTPIKIPEVSIGSQIVRLELENHRVWTTTTRVAAGQESRVTGSLEPIR
jgi:hypothetical protein